MAPRAGRPPLEDPFDIQVQAKFNRAGIERLDALVAALALEAPHVGKPTRASVIRWLIDKEAAARSLDKAEPQAPATSVRAPAPGSHGAVEPSARTAWATTLAARAADRWRLTQRETKVLELSVTGLDNSAISKTLGCSLKTVKVHLTNLLNKLGVSSQAAAAELAHEALLNRADPGGSPLHTDRPLKSPVQPTSKLLS